MTPSNLKAVRFEISGLEEYLKKIQAAGASIDEVVTEAVEQSGHPIYEDILDWAAKHELTGATKKGVAISGVQKDGNRYYVEVGIDTSKSKYAWHAVFVEYGTPTQAADPGIRRAFQSNRRKVISIQKRILKERGIPVG